MRILWSIIGSFLGLILLSILFQQLRPVHTDNTHAHPPDFASRGQILNAPMPEVDKQAMINPTKEPLDVRIQSPSVEPVIEVTDDDRLRVFDEL